MAAIRIYFDGAYYPDTGDMFSVVVCAKEPFLQSTGVGGSSTHSEWISAVAALEFAADRGFTDIILIGDNENVIEAMRGEKGAHQIQARYKRYADAMCQEIGRVEWKWISTVKNPAGEIIRQLGDLRKEQVF